MNPSDLFASSKVTGLWVFISSIVLTILAGLFMVIGAVLGVFFFSMKGAIAASSGLLLIAALVLMTLIIILLLILMFRCFSSGKEKRSNYQSVLQSIIPLLTPQNFKDIYCALKAVLKGLKKASDIVGTAYSPPASPATVNVSNSSNSLSEAFDMLKKSFLDFQNNFTGGLPSSATLPQVDLSGNPVEALRNLQGWFDGTRNILHTPAWNTTQLYTDISNIKAKMGESLTYFHELGHDLEIASQGAGKIMHILEAALNPQSNPCTTHLTLIDGTDIDIETL